MWLVFRAKGRGFETPWGQQQDVDSSEWRFDLFGEANDDEENLKVALPRYSESVTSIWVTP